MRVGVERYGHRLAVGITQSPCGRVASYRRILLNRKPITSTIRTTAMMPVTIPALKIAPIASQPEAAMARLTSNTNRNGTDGLGPPLPRRADHQFPYWWHVDGLNR